MVTRDATCNHATPTHQSCNSDSDGPAMSAILEVADFPAIVNGPVVSAIDEVADFPAIVNGSVCHDWVCVTEGPLIMVSPVSPGPVSPADSSESRYCSRLHQPECGTITVGDGGRWEMGDGRWEMGDGRWEMGDGRWEMGDGRWEMGDGRWEMGDGRWEMGDGRWEMGDGRWEMGDGRWEMGDGRWEMGDGDGRWEMGDGRWEMGDGRWEMGDGRWEMGDGRWEMGDGRWEMGDGRWEMGDGRWEMGDGRWEMGDGRWEMGDGRWEMGDGRWEMGDGRWEMGDGREKILKVPGNVSPTAALGLFGVPGCTAYCGLHDILKLKEGESLIVSAAAGNYWINKLAPVVDEIQDTLQQAIKIFACYEYGLMFDYTAAVDESEVNKCKKRVRGLIANDVFLSAIQSVQGVNTSVPFSHRAVIVFAS
ncbi:hypothetical protein EV702DRAFT_1048841 [Suillus placidus]|uniref:Uncharacterized protein n=1 Tax=Suillus placidus TaxID=48579 RepID=A0A9P7CYQ3_9AGAM|nr:hypothetical protein EV702DRAFT_1048841 [Suillus placidus]